MAHWRQSTLVPILFALLATLLLLAGQGNAQTTGRLWPKSAVPGTPGGAAGRPCST
jgi:hypothetical protein